MNFKLLLSIIFITIVTVCCQTFATDIINLHQNDAAGRPAAPYRIGTAVTVAGTVTVPRFIFNSAALDVYIQDSTGGVNIITNSTFPQPVRLGQRVRVTGTITQLYGHTKIKDPSEWFLIAENDTMPAPVSITCHELANCFYPDNSEPNESRLVRINDVTVQMVNGDYYTISDSTASAILYSNPEAGLPAPPDGRFDVMGVIRQVDMTTRPPVKSGYQICPRFAEDFISKSGPLLVEQPYEAVIEPRQITIKWRTDKPATSIFKFGLTSAHELPAVGDSTRVSDHSVTLRNLEPVTLYRGRAYSSDDAGTAASTELIFMTSSERSSGTIQAYFNQTVDPAYAWRETAKGKVDLSKTIIERIDRAKYSLDVHYYSFTHDDIATALINAHNRGVLVRFICDDQALSGGNKDIERIRNAGIAVISDRFGDNDGSAASHNKFVIIDHRDHREGSDDYLWTGSANATYAGATGNGENMLLIQDESLCAAYTIEFNEMWGSDTETPNPANAKFGSRKTDNTPHRFNVGGVLVEQYMSPSDNTEDHIITAIKSADHDLSFCILTFTQDNLAKALRTRRLQEPNLSLRGVFDKEDAINNSASEYASMSGSGSNAWIPAADVHLDVLGDLLHHKYLLVDAGSADSDPLVVTGSHNWSNAANTVNDENTLIIHSRRVSNLYLQEFAARYKESGGQGSIISAVHLTALNSTPNQFVLRQNYPNPFNGSTKIDLFLPESDQKQTLNLTIYNIQGCAVAHRVLPFAAAGWTSISWDGRTERGQPLPSGVYYACLAGHKRLASIKMAIIR